jgi:hypothetical protein
MGEMSFGRKDNCPNILLVKRSLTSHSLSELLFMGKVFFGQKVIGLNIILVDSRLHTSFIGERFHNHYH